MCRIYRSIFGSLPPTCPFPGHSLQGSTGHSATLRRFPPSLLRPSGGQTAPSSLLPAARLSPLAPTTTHTHTFAEFVVRNPCLAGQEPPALVCRVIQHRASSMFYLSFLVSSPRLMAGATFCTYHHTVLWHMLNTNKLESL